MARKKQFKAESKQLLDLMIHSIYTNREIFLRELISNASDALDKLYFKGLQDAKAQKDKDSFVIDLSVDKDLRQIIISDTGIGMDEKELELNLGTIAKSDSKQFKEALEEGDSSVDIIGQFGVGFYAAFMVSSKVEVISRKDGASEAFKFTSNGIDGFTVEESERDTQGTTIICTLKESSEEEDFEIFLDSDHLKSLVKTYSDYVRFPIKFEGETINSQIPLWKRSKNDVSEEELVRFYQEKFHDHQDPMKTIQVSVEGTTSFDALLYIPNHMPQNFFTMNYEPGLQLYSRGVFIMEHNKDLIPEHFRFVRGLVDSPDLPLNISREILQDDRQIKMISNRIERKIKDELEKMKKNDRVEYDIFWTNFGLSIKYGVYADFGMHKDKLKNLLLFESSHGEGYVSLEEYVERMKEDQKEIYYIAGESRAKCMMQPQTEFVLGQGFEVLYLSDEIDEFVIQVLHEFDSKTFKSINSSDLDLVDEETKTKVKEKTESSKDLLEALKELLIDKVDDVVFSSTLLNHPVSLVSEDGLSFEMEKILNAMPEGPEGIKAKRILELNPNHSIVESLDFAFTNKDERLESYAKTLYDQACLIEGLPLDNPVEFSQRIAELMVMSSKH